MTLVYCLFHVLTFSIHSLALNILQNWNPNMPLPKGKQFDFIVKKTAGLDEFKLFMDNVTADATRRHKYFSEHIMGVSKPLEEYVPVTGVTYQEGGYDCIVAKICFADGICWSAKIRPTREAVPDIYHEYETTTLLEKYCPHIPMSRFMGGDVSENLTYHFTEWIEGETALDKWEQQTSGSRDMFIIPSKVFTSLVEFVYNLTTCPIPGTEMAELKRTMYDEYGFLNRSTAQLEALNASVWVREKFLSLSRPWLPSGMPFDGLDEMLLLSWLLKKFEGTEEQPFVLHYWDLRPPNIILNENDDLVGIVDWAQVRAVPLKLSAWLRAEVFYGANRNAEMSGDLEKLFYRKLRRIEEEKASSTMISDMYKFSQENRFLWLIVGPVVMDLRRLHREYPELVDEALERSPENLASAAREWKSFASHWNNPGDPIPDHPSFVEIQEGLGLYGRTPLERSLRRIKRTAQKRLNVLIWRLYEWIPKFQ